MSDRPRPKAATSSTERRPPAPNPLQPRPRMLVVLSIVFVLWVAFLLTMYFTTVYPHRHIETRPTLTTSFQVPTPRTQIPARNLSTGQWYD